MRVIRRERQQERQYYQPQETVDQALLAFRRLKKVEDMIQSTVENHGYPDEGLGQDDPPGQM
jgi:hypothetical protein